MIRIALKAWKMEIAEPIPINHTIENMTPRRSIASTVSCAELLAI